MRYIVEVFADGDTVIVRDLGGGEDIHFAIYESHDYAISMANRLRRLLRRVGVDVRKGRNRPRLL